MVCILLTPRHRATRRRWAAEHRDWKQHDWSQVLFTDESRFSLECDTRRVLVWRDRGNQNNPAFVRERSQYRRAGWMVWGGISIGGRTDLHIIRNDTLTGRRYADEILRPYVIPYARAIKDSFVFQDDNARPHRARLVENMLEAETIQRMEWPAFSPDLNPIEHVWDMLGRRIAARPRPPATVRDLEIALLEEWNSIPQSLIDNLIASMANRLFHPCFAMSVERFLKLDEALGLLNTLDSDERDVEVFVLPPDISGLTDEDEGHENEINTGGIIVNDVPGCFGG
ncbi:transposable element Tcb2 transposase [Trichonephila clavipes]|nr:transposable element Tcb2 transposase [Trichonephila clavipes]